MRSPLQKSKSTDRSGRAVVLVPLDPGAMPNARVLHDLVDALAELGWPSVAVGAALNEVLIGPMVRCGPGLPAVFVIAFFAATRLDRRRLVIAIALCLAAVTLQSFYDPNLGVGFLVAGVPIVLASGLAGNLVRSRARMAAGVRSRMFPRVRG